MSLRPWPRRNYRQRSAPRTPRSKGTVIGDVPHPGFVERNLGVVLTFVAAAATAGVAFFGGIFKANEPPTAHIALPLGDTRVAIEEGASPPTQLPIVPVGTTLRFSGASSRDPDGIVNQLEFRWTVFDLFPATGVASSPPPVLGSAGRSFEWKADYEGMFQVALDVTDNHQCNWLQRMLAEGGCRKTSTAIMHFSARRPNPPFVKLENIQPTVILPLSLPVDASQTKAFDGGPVRFAWTLNNTFVSDAASFTLSIGQPGGPFEVAGEYVLRGTVLDSWGQSAATERKISVISPIASSVPSRTPPGQVASANAAASEVLVMNAEKTIGSVGESYRLPSKIVTNGHSLSILAKDLVADGARIIAFEEADVAPSAAGSPGVNGQQGSGEGAAGQPGGKGLDGPPGMPGKSAGSIRIEAQTFAGSLDIQNSGTTGGRGGDGGRGGQGGGGVRGSPASSSLFDCKRGPGRGGDGGPGGQGGASGPGGAGGSGGSVVILIGSTSPNSHINVVSAGAKGGDAGRPGPPGEGGGGGPEGATSGLCGGAGRAGQRGYSGAPGAFASVGTSGTPGTIVLQIDGQRLEGQARLQYPPAR
jgi:hypothetical protein